MTDAITRPSKPVTLGEHWSFNLRGDPKRLAFVLARYRLAAEAVAQGANVLELGCSEGIGAAMLLERAARYTGVDMDGDAIAAAQANWANGTDKRSTFIEADFLGQRFGQFDAVVSLDVVEHIAPAIEDRYFQTVVDHLTDRGAAVIGTPNKTSEAWASPMSKAGHINLFDGKRLRQTMRRFFHHVYLFGLNDEVVHTGFEPMTHYLACVGFSPRRGAGDD